MKPLTPSQAIDALIGDEEQNGKQKEKTGSGPPTQLPWIGDFLNTINIKIIF